MEKIMSSANDNLINSIIKVDYSALDRNKMYNYRPEILVFDKFVYRISSWEELLKLFYYLCYKTPGGAEYFDALVNKDLAVVDCKITYCTARYTGKPIRIRNKYVFADNLFRSYNGIKFYKNHYVSCVQTIIDNYYSLIIDGFIESSVIDNLKIIGHIIESLKLKNIDIYISDSQLPSEQIETEKEEIILELTKKTKSGRKYEKKTKYFIARINGEILSPEEKFYNRIEKEFDKKILLGDIVISAEEEGFLKSFMNFSLQRLKASGQINTHFPEVFAFGLVRYAMKYYSQKIFWRYFNQEYGVDVDVVNQSTIHWFFREVMLDHGKTYSDGGLKIDNISMHSFVTDRCANQFFDYLFDFWRLDLKRDIEFIYGENGAKYFNILIDEIKANNDQSVNNIMKHTSMALELNEKSCRLRIKRILQMIDDCFWHQTEIPQTGNRINELLRNWMSIPNGKFKQELKSAIRKTGSRGETLLSSPQLTAKFSHNIFSIKLPQEILPHCGDNERPHWVISADNLKSITVEPALYYGRIGKYTEECEIDLPQEYLFEKISLTLLSSERSYAKFPIKQSDFKFFNDKGILIEHTKSLPEGNLVVYSHTSSIPQILYKDEQNAEDLGGFFVSLYTVEKGDIIQFPDQSAIQVGERIKEGLAGARPLEAVSVKIDGTDIPIYNQLPKILFFAKQEQIGGTALVIEDSASSRVHRITESYYKLKIDEALDDVYAYLVDLKEYVQDDGIYKVNINIPQSRAIYQYEFVHLNGLTFQFKNAPYIFTDNGIITFGENAHVVTNKDWDIDSKTYHFNFDKNSQDCSREVNDRDLVINYNVNQTVIPLYFRIPALFWKYSKTDEWNHNQPSDLSLRTLPKHLYVSGPFDFKSKTTKINVEKASYFNFDETDIYADKVKDTDYFSFPLSNLKSWLDYTYTLRKFNIALNGVSHPLFRVICKSIVLKANISGDYDTDTIHGYFEIAGDGEYSVKVERDGCIIGQDIPLENGEFELDTEILGGKYTVTVYEIFEDESGFDSDSVKIGEFVLNLVNLSDLEGNIIYIKSFQDCEKKYQARELSNDYVVKDLRLIGKFDKARDLNVMGLWRLDFDDEDEMKNCLFYSGTLVHVEQNNYYVDFPVLLLFYSRYDVNKVIILREYDGEYLELLYDIKTHCLVKDESGLDRRQRRERLKTLEDDRYDCIIEVQPETEKIRKMKEIKEVKTFKSINIAAPRSSTGTPIEELHFSQRTYTILKRARLDTLESLAAKTLKEMYKVRNLGRTCVEEIERTLLKYNLKFKEE